MSFNTTLGSITYRELIKEDLPRILDEHIVPGIYNSGSTELHIT